MTDSIAANTDNKIAPGAQVEGADEFEITKLMKQIEELQTQMTKLTVPVNSNSIANRVISSGLHTALKQQESEALDTAINLAIPSPAEALVEEPATALAKAVEEVPAMKPSLQDLTAEEAFNALVSSTPPQSQSLTDNLASALSDALAENLAEIKADVQVEVPSQVVAEVSSSFGESTKTTETTEINDFFKEIEGGEESLLAETLANLSEHAVDSLPSQPELREPKSELLESESLLASVLAPPAPTSSFQESIVAEPVPTKPDDTMQGAVKMNEFRKVLEEGYPSKATSADNVLSMTMTGQTSLKLKFEYENEEIMVHFNADMIHIQFSEGSEFKIPVKRGRLKKAA